MTEEHAKYQVPGAGNRPQCAHKVVRHTPALVPGTGTSTYDPACWTDRWVCSDCGLEFRPVEKK